MIAVIYMFGPMHGMTEYHNGPLQREREIMVPNPPSFQEYRFGEPYGPPRTSMLAERHVYFLYDQMEDGVQEGAIYLHHEQCCDRGYDTSEDYKRMFNRRENRPQILPLPGEDVINFGNPARAPKRNRKKLEEGK